MSQNILASFPDTRRRTIRQEINPMDKSTIVSIFPKLVHEYKRTIQPGEFIIDPGSRKNPSILVVGPSSWWKEIDEEQPILEIPVSSVQIADSIVKDYCNGMLGCDMNERQPGLFFIPGELNINEILNNYNKILDLYEAKQRNWYQQLVKMADSLWARSNGNPLAIDDNMRMAAIELNLRDKDWMKEFKMSELTRCIACGSMSNPAFPVCPTCKAITDPEKAKNLGIKFAS